MDSDHRLVTVTMWRKNDFERTKKVKAQTTIDPTLLFLQKKKSTIIEKMANAKILDDLKREKNRTTNAIKRRKAFLTTKTMLEEADEILNAKDNAQASLALKRIIKRPAPKIKEIATKELTKHFGKHFKMGETGKNVSEFSTTFFQLVSQKEVMAAVKALKNGKAAEPDGLKAEDVKKMDPAELTKLMNDMIKNNDAKLKNGYLAPILKQGKDPFKPDSYRPVTLLSVYRKILSRILLRRINPILDRETAKSKYAYRAERSTGDIVLVHKYLISAVKMK